MLAVDQRLSITNRLRQLSGAGRDADVSAVERLLVEEGASRHRHPRFAPNGPRLALTGHEFAQRQPEVG
jgi:hypothetical protein